MEDSEDYDLLFREEEKKDLSLAISASRSHVFEACSLKYYFQYLQKVPQEKTAALTIGDVTHSVLELLAAPKHLKLYEKILEDNSVEDCAAVKRYVRIKTYNENLSAENLDKIYFCIASGVAAKLLKTEGRIMGVEIDFDITEENRYRSRGYIDMAILFYEKTLRIIDFKSSSKVYSGKDIDENIQALIYGLAASKLYPNYSIVVDFYFLFLKQWQRFKITKSKLAKFEKEFEKLYAKMAAFTEKDKMSNVAAFQGFPTDGSFSKKLNCGFSKYPGQLKKDGSLMFSCCYKWKLDYFGLFDSRGKLIRTALNKKELEYKIQEGEEIRELKHLGCPAFIPKR